MSTKIIVICNLKPGKDPAAYEKWAREVDIPSATSLKSIDGFDLLRATGIFGSDEAPPYQYIEVLEVNSVEGLASEMAASEAMQQVAAQYQEWTDNPIFILTEPV
ncbi:MAG: REDY-like protein HapK [Gammaproteobacteria bacterium AqS3]|nr:REDY-like protein HapK [Gammaproteobacteria bacterium AqS3]